MPGLCCDAAAYPPILATVRRPPTDLSSRRTSLWCINHCCQYFNWRKTTVPERSRARRVDPSAAMMCNVYGILGDAVEAHPGNVLKPRRALVVAFASVRFLSSVSEARSGLSQLHRKSFRRRALSRIPSALPDPACGSAPACARSRRFCRDSGWGLLKRRLSLARASRLGVLIQPLP